MTPQGSVKECPRSAYPFRFLWGVVGWQHNVRSATGAHRLHDPGLSVGLPCHTAGAWNTGHTHNPSNDQPWHKKVCHFATPADPPAPPHCETNQQLKGTGQMSAMPCSPVSLHVVQ